MALVAYRHLLRSARVAFQDDLRLLHAAQTQAREAFRSKASLPFDDPAVRAAIEHAESVAKILRENIVQGKNVGDNKYKLRIHDKTERGDNDTVKMPSGKKVIIDGKTCADR